MADQEERHHARLFINRNSPFKPHAAQHRGLASEMTFYWLLFFVPAWFALSSRASTPSAFNQKYSIRLNTIWIGALFILTLLIGYRFEVGGDWGSYLRHLGEARYDTGFSAISRGDPAYRLLNLLAVRQGWNISGVNLISGFLFSIGLIIFCRGLPRPWLALTIAIPYLVIVVAMGYTRQSIALGLSMLGLVALMRKENRMFVIWIILAATFHKSAVLLLPIAALAATHNKYWTSLWIGVVSLVAYYIFLDPSVDSLYMNYVEAQYQSQGAIIRASMNLVPAVLYLSLSKRFLMQYAEARLWRWFSILSIVLFFAAIAMPTTTAVDRIALYMLPLQLVIFSYLPDVLGKRGGQNNGLVCLILAYYACVLFVWLNFASHSNYWIPYRFYPFEVWF
jgi:hypothetical protein